MTNTAIRQELKGLIDDLGDRNLYTAKTILTALVENELPVIERPVYFCIA